MNKNDVKIGSTNPLKINFKHWSKDQKERAEEMCKRIKPAYAKIRADSICNTKNLEKVLAMTKDIGFMNVRNHLRYNEYKALKPFDTHLKNLILNYVIYSSASGETIYKEKLAKKVNASHKTVQKIIKDLIAEGSFIEMAAHSITEKDKDYRIINIRPSIDVSVAYIDYNIRAIINDMKFVSAWTKIKLHFEFDYNDSVVA
jgi:protoheme ferro-lyase